MDKCVLYFHIFIIITIIISNNTNLSFVGPLHEPVYKDYYISFILLIIIIIISPLDKSVLYEVSYIFCLSYLSYILFIIIHVFIINSNDFSFVSLLDKSVLYEA